jgi:hypothetical protein
MYSCAVQMSGRCFGTTIGYRGVCSRCYEELVGLGIICQGDGFKDFPFWLQEMIRCQDKEDHIQVRHPTKKYSEEVLDENQGSTRQYLGPGCFKLKSLPALED